MFKQCLICKKDFKVYPSTFERRKTCSKRCHYVFRSRLLKGTRPACAGSWKGRFHTEVTKRKISETRIKKQIAPFSKGKHLSEKHREGIRQTLLAKEKDSRIDVQCKQCEKIFKIYETNNRIFCSKKCAENFLSGKNHYNWQGGIGKEPYPFEWTETLKESIRQRDRYRCKLCRAPQKEFIRKLSVHHIDYDKNNLNPNNLVTLCGGCNTKVNYNREHWKNHFQNEREEVDEDIYSAI